MSLDLYLETKPCETCGHSEENFFQANYTYNVSPMWYVIYPDDNGMVQIDGMTGQESIEKLEHAILQMSSDPAKFQALNPENGWGSFNRFFYFLMKLLEAAREHPEAIWRSYR